MLTARVYVVGCVLYALIMNLVLLAVLLWRRRLMPGLDWFLIFLGFIFLTLFNVVAVYLSSVETNLGGWTKLAVTLLAIKATLFNIGFARHLKHTYEVLELPGRS